MYIVLLITLSNCASFLSKSDFKKEYKKVSVLNTLNGTYNLQPSKRF